MNDRHQAAPAAATLRVTALEHAYARQTVLEHINLELPAGRVLVLLGPSGCGKTTLLHLCAGLLTVQTGHIASTFQRPAMMFQQPRLLPWKTTLANIALGLKAQGMQRRAREAHARALATTLGLDERALEQFPHALSGGMQSRAALARALVLEPDLLLMDEPFSALDIGLRTQLHQLLLDEQARRGLAVLMITHDPMEAVRLADTILVLAASPGRIVQRFDFDLPAWQRSEQQVHHLSAELLAAPQVRASFGLAPLAATTLASASASTSTALPPHSPAAPASTPPAAPDPSTPAVATLRPSAPTPPAPPKEHACG